MGKLKVKQLAIYPVKSLGQVTRQQLLLDELGAVDDRRFMLVDENGLFISQRTCREMALIKVKEEGGGFILCRPDGSTTPLPRLSADDPYPETELVSGEIWGDTVQALLVKGEVSEWLQDTLKTKCRLLYIPKPRARQLGKEYLAEGSALVGFADRYPFLLTASKSLDDFNTHLEAPITMQRFRPNIEIEGSEAWAEDGWQRLRIGEVIFRVAAPSARCQVPSIDPDTAEMQPAVSRALARHRRREGKTYFGQNLVQEEFSQENPGMIAVGDMVQILD